MMLKREKAEDMIHVLSIGPFGHAVAGYLKNFSSDVAETAARGNSLPLPETWPSSRMNILASWRPAPSLCELLEDVSFSCSRPFIPLIQDSIYLRLGPVVIPGGGCCWTCWAK